MGTPTATDTGKQTIVKVSDIENYGKKHPKKIFSQKAKKLIDSNSAYVNQVLEENQELENKVQEDIWKDLEKKFKSLDSVYDNLPLYLNLLNGALHKGLGNKKYDFFVNEKLNNNITKIGYVESVYYGKMFNEIIIKLDKDKILDNTDILNLFENYYIIQYFINSSDIKSDIVNLDLEYLLEIIRLIGEKNHNFYGNEKAFYPESLVGNIKTREEKMKGHFPRNRDALIEKIPYSSSDRNHYSASEEIYNEYNSVEVEIERLDEQIKEEKKLVIQNKKNHDTKLIEVSFRNSDKEKNITEYLDYISSMREITETDIKIILLLQKNIGDKIDSEIENKIESIIDKYINITKDKSNTLKNNYQKKKYSGLYIKALKLTGKDNTDEYKKLLENLTVTEDNIIEILTAEVLDCNDKRVIKCIEDIVSEISIENEDDLINLEDLAYPWSPYEEFEIIVSFLTKQQKNYYYNKFKKFYEISHDTKWKYENNTDHFLEILAILDFYR